MNPNGLYLFDEPEAALSPQRQLTLLMQIYRFAKEGAQFIIVTHSPILLGIPDADIYLSLIHISYRIWRIFKACIRFPGVFGLCGERVQ